MLLEVAQVIYLSASSIGLLLHTAMLYGLSKRKETSFKYYRIFLAVFSVHGSIFCAFTILCQPACMVEGDFFGQIALGPIKMLSQQEACYFIQFWDALTVLEWLLLPSFFIFQYLSFVRGRVNVLMVIFIYIYVMITALPFFYFLNELHPTKEFYAKFRSVPRSLFNLSDDFPIVMMAGTSNSLPENGGKTTVPTLASLVGAFILCYCLMVFCSYHIRRRLQQQRISAGSLLPNTIRRQIDVSRMLRMQAMLPITLITVPIILVSLSCIFNYSLGEWSVFIGICCNIVSPLQAALSIYYICPPKMWLPFYRTAASSTTTRIYDTNRITESKM